MELSGLHEGVSQRYPVANNHPKDGVLTQASDYTVKTHFFSDVMSEGSPHHLS